MVFRSEHNASRPRLDIALEKNGFIADSSKMYVMAGG